MDTCIGPLHGTFDERFTEHNNRFGNVNVQLIIQCPIYRAPQHDSCHGVSQRIKFAYVIKVPCSGTR